MKVSQSTHCDYSLAGSAIGSVFSGIGVACTSYSLSQLPDAITDCSKRLGEAAYQFTIAMSKNPKELLEATTRKNLLEDECEWLIDSAKGYFTHLRLLSGVGLTVSLIASAYLVVKKCRQVSPQPKPKRSRGAFQPDHPLKSGDDLDKATTPPMPARALADRVTAQQETRARSVVRAAARQNSVR